MTFSASVFAQSDGGTIPFHWPGNEYGTITRIVAAAAEFKTMPSIFAVQSGGATRGMTMVHVVTVEFDMATA